MSVKEIARMLGIGYKAAFFMVRKLRRSLYARRIYERLQGEVEIDKTYVKAGLKGKRGLRREPRKRGLKSRGRGIYGTDKVPVVVAVARKSDRVRIQPNRNVKGRVVIRRYQCDVDPSARIYTDDFPSYNTLSGNKHLSVKHGEGEYSDGNGVHINTAEAEFSVLRPWIATLRGVSKEKLYLYICHYEFLRNHRELGHIERTLKMLKILRILCLPRCCQPLTTHLWT